MNQPFWEKSYQDDSVSTFGVVPNISILDFEKFFKKDWNILDVGCGEGKNPIYLANNGYKNIDAFDISQNAINKLNKLAEKDNLQINSWVQDLCQFEFNREYDLIMSHGTLHFVSKMAWRNFLFSAKKNTNIGGIHIIQIFTNKLPASPDIAPFAIGLADENELAEIYSDWETLEFKSYVFEDEHPGAPKHFHATNKIIVRKR